MNKDYTAYSLASLQALGQKVLNDNIPGEICRYADALNEKLASEEGISFLKKHPNAAASISRLNRIVDNIYVATFSSLAIEGFNQLVPSDFKLSSEERKLVDAGKKTNTEKTLSDIAQKQTQFVVDSIQGKSTSKSRIIEIESWIFRMAKCVAKKDFFSAFSIYLSLVRLDLENQINSNPVFSPRAVEVFNKVNNLLSPTDRGIKESFVEMLKHSKDRQLVHPSIIGERVAYLENSMNTEEIKAAMLPFLQQLKISNYDYHTDTTDLVSSSIREDILKIDLNKIKSDEKVSLKTSTSRDRLHSMLGSISQNNENILDQLPKIPMTLKNQFRKLYDGIAKLDQKLNKDDLLLWKNIVYSNMNEALSKLDDFQSYPAKINHTEFRDLTTEYINVLKQLKAQLNQTNVQNSTEESTLDPMEKIAEQSGLQVESIRVIEQAGEKIWDAIVGQALKIENEDGSISYAEVEPGNEAIQALEDDLNHNFFSRIQALSKDPEKEPLLIKELKAFNEGHRPIDALRRNLKDLLENQNALYEDKIASMQFSKIQDKAVSNNVNVSLLNAISEILGIDNPKADTFWKQKTRRGVLPDGIQAIRKILANSELSDNAKLAAIKGQAELSNKKRAVIFKRNPIVSRLYNELSLALSNQQAMQKFVHGNEFNYFYSKNSSSTATNMLKQSPVDFKASITLENHILADWNRVGSALLITINGKKLADILMEDRNTSRLTAPLFNNLDELKSFFDKHFLKNTPENKKNAAMEYLLKTLHQGALLYPASSAVSFTLFRCDLIAPNLGKKDELPPKYSHVNFNITEHGFTVEDTVTYKTIMDPNSDDITVKPDEGKDSVIHGHSVIAVDILNETLEVKSNDLLVESKKVASAIDRLNLLVKQAEEKVSNESSIEILKEMAAALSQTPKNMEDHRSIDELKKDLIAKIHADTTKIESLESLLNKTPSAYAYFSEHKEVNRAVNLITDAKLAYMQVGGKQRNLIKMNKLVSGINDIARNDNIHNKSEKTLIELIKFYKAEQNKTVLGFFGLQSADKFVNKLNNKSPRYSKHTRYAGLIIKTLLADASPEMMSRLNTIEGGKYRDIINSIQHLNPLSYSQIAFSLSDEKKEALANIKSKYGLEDWQIVKIYNHLDSVKHEDIMPNKEFIDALAQVNPDAVRFEKGKTISLEAFNGIRADMRKMKSESDVTNGEVISEAPRVR